MSRQSVSLDQDVVIIGAGAAGIAAGLRLAQSRLRFLIVEARTRLGGRAFTTVAGGYPLDLGCGWLHSADRNPWTRRVRPYLRHDQGSPGVYRRIAPQ